MRRLLLLLPFLVILVACASPIPPGPKPTLPLPTQTNRPSAPPSPTPANSPISLSLFAISTDPSGYRQALVQVTIRGPLVLNPSVCGTQGPVVLWAVNAKGHTLPSDLIYAMLCQHLTLQFIPAGSDKIVNARASWPAAAGAVTIHGKVALAKGTLPVPPLLIPAAN